MTEYTALRFDWNDVAHQCITRVLGKHPCILSDGSASWDAVAICIDDKFVIISTEPDTDQIEITLSKELWGDGWEVIPSFSFAVAQPLGWCWVGMNSQGYKDSFTLAFGGIVGAALEPRCTFIVEASTISCFDLVPHR
jgi:hypothetical protein